MALYDQCGILITRTPFLKETDEKTCSKKAFFEMAFRVPQAIKMAFINRKTFHRLHPVEQAALIPEADQIFCPGKRIDVIGQKFLV